MVTRRRAQPWVAALAVAVTFLVLASSAQAEALGGIEGTVSNAETHAPLPGIEVCAIFSGAELLGEEPGEYEHVFGCATTSSGGEYDVPELRAGSYFLEFVATSASKLDYIPQLYNDTLELGEATQVAVAVGMTSPEIDATLSPGAEISGTVTDAATGAPIEKALACSLRANAKGVYQGFLCARAEADGEYTLRGLPSGSYKLEFFAPGFEPGYYKDQGSESGAELVSVIAPVLTAGIDDALKPGGPQLSSSGSTSSESAPGEAPPGGLTTRSGTTPDARLSLAGRRVVARNGDALVKVDCSGAESCRAKLTLRLKVRIVVKGKKTLHTTTLGTSAVLSLAAGKTAIVEIKLTSAGRRLLREHPRSDVALALVTPGRKQNDSVVLVRQDAPSKR
jgi:hypothetical protein